MDGAVTINVSGLHRNLISALIPNFPMHLNADTDLVPILCCS